MQLTFSYNIVFKIQPISSCPNWSLKQNSLIMDWFYRRQSEVRTMKWTVDCGDIPYDNQFHQKKFTYTYCKKIIVKQIKMMYCADQELTNKFQTFDSLWIIFQQWLTQNILIHNIIKCYGGRNLKIATADDVIPTKLKNQTKSLVLLFFFSGKCTLLRVLEHRSLFDVVHSPQQFILILSIFQVSKNQWIVKIVGDWSRISSSL